MSSDSGATSGLLGSSPSVVVSCHNLERRISARFTLGPITTDFRREVTCVVGMNGAGKSTLLRLLAGIDEPSGGTIQAQTATLSVGYLPQSPGFPERATVRQFLSYASWLHEIESAKTADAIAWAAERAELTDRLEDQIGALSGGMLRRLGVAYAIIHRPALVLLDEPTAGLDAVHSVELRDTIRGLGDSAVVMASHRVEDVRFADRVVVLRGGSTSFDGTVDELEKLSIGGDSDLESTLARIMQ